MPFTTSEVLYTGRADINRSQLGSNTIDPDGFRNIVYDQRERLNPRIRS